MIRADPIIYDDLGLAVLEHGVTCAGLKALFDMHGIVACERCDIFIGWFQILTRAYGNNGRSPRQKLVFGILQHYKLFIHYYSTV